ncbi:MAG: hypothetical protein DHS20C15_28060 [Planctomycetota bacterium]|nr:MAG: hypothetical protein DHS20C15_28060 [Planctomycetota bacterium]
MLTTCSESFRRPNTASSTPPPPNILFIYSDDHATAAIGPYANSAVALHSPTPYIDALAAASLRFDCVYCTNFIYAPARAVVLMGKHSHLNGLRDLGYVFDGSQVTIPKPIRERSYQTAMFGK